MIEGPWKLAPSSRMSVVASVISLSCPPMMPAMTEARSASAMTSMSVVSVRCSPSRVTMVSPGAARRTMIRRPRMVWRSKACSGWPKRPEHVVGHVHHVADGPHAGVGELRLEPEAATRLP